MDFFSVKNLPFSTKAQKNEFISNMCKYVKSHFIGRNEFIISKRYLYWLL